MKQMISYVHKVVCRIQEGRLKELYEQWLWIFQYVRRFWLQIGGYTLLTMTGSLFGLGTSVVSKNLVDSVTGHRGSMLGIAAAAYVGVGIGQIFISAMRSRVTLKINLYISNQIRLDIFNQVIQTDWEAISEYSPGDLQYRLNGDVMVVINNVLTFIPTLCSMLVSFGGAFIIMMQNDPVMALIALCGVPLSLIVSRYNLIKMREYQKKNQEFFSQNVSFNQEIFQNLQTIKAFGIVDTFIQRYTKQQETAIGIQLDQNKYQQKGTILTSLVGQMIGYACYGFAIYRLWKGRSHLWNDDNAGWNGRLFAQFPWIGHQFGSECHTCVYQCGPFDGNNKSSREIVEDYPKLKKMISEARETGVKVQMEHVAVGYPGGRLIYRDR